MTIQGSMMECRISTTILNIGTRSSTKTEMYYKYSILDVFNFSTTKARRSRIKITFFQMDVVGVYDFFVIIELYLMFMHCQFQVTGFKL